jgi:hypothetical protein
VRAGGREQVRGGRMSCWIGKESKNRKPTVIKLTKKKERKKSTGKDEQTNKNQKQTNKQNLQVQEQ